MNAWKIAGHPAVDDWCDVGKAMEFLIPFGVLVVWMILMAWVSP